MPPRIVFVIMSAVHSAAAVAQLARALAPHRVLIHHDFAQTPAFEVDAPNVTFVPDPKRTGWACWGFSEAIFHSLRHAVENHTFDYLQLLSPSCLPIRPLAEFEMHVASPDFDADFDYVDLLDDREALMTVGYRAFSPEHSLRHRVLRRLSSYYFASKSGRRVRDVAGVQLLTGAATNSRGELTMRARIALCVVQAWSRPEIGRHIFDERLPASFGSIWFGARRQVVSQILERFADPRLQSYFSRLRIADEFLIPTLLRATGARRRPSNHFVNTFDASRPNWLDEDDFDRLRECGAYFARKFRDDPFDALRQRVLNELVAVPRGARAACPER